MMKGKVLIDLTKKTVNLLSNISNISPAELFLLS
jgi:hypothetical protein